MKNLQTITRRTRNLGWGYTFTPGGKVAEPDYTGTIKQVLDKKNNDKTFEVHSKMCNFSESCFD